MQRPNILLLYTDQQRWDALGANGNRDIQTPNLDRLAGEGVNLDRFFVQNAVCMPSRVSMLTGQYPATLGIVRNGVPVPADTVVLPHLLRNYGYHSANIGKLHFLPHANRDHRDTHPAYGFDYLEISDEPGCYEDAYRAWVQRKAPDQLDCVSVGLPPATEVWQKTMGIDDGIRHPEQRFPKEAIPFAGRSDLTHSAFVAEQTMAYLQGHGTVHGAAHGAAHPSRPFFCIAGFYSPHSPWVAPQEYIDLYDPDALTLPTFPPEINAQRSQEVFSDHELRTARQGYYAMVSEVDGHVGRILDCLDELGLTENTIVVFTSDHGEWLGEHLRYGKGYPGHDCVTRVPCIVRWPEGLAKPGRTAHDLVEAVDLVPTLLECAGIPAPYHIQGHSFLGLLSDTNYTKRSSALTEMNGWKTVRTERFRYVAEADGRESLYDLERDPAAYHNVAGEPGYTQALTQARRELIARLLERERPIPRVWPY